MMKVHRDTQVLAIVFCISPNWTFFLYRDESKLKFEIYGGRLLGPDKAIGAIVTTIKDISEGCGGDGGGK